MTSDWLSDDDRLLAELRSALVATGTIPDDVVTAAKAVFDLRTLDEELALLTYDSRQDAELAGAFRSERMAVRSLVFGFGDVTLDIDVLPDSFVGQISPAMTGTIVVEMPTRPAVRAEIDELGMFSVAVSTPGDVRFRVEPTGATPFVTEWTRL